MKQSVLLPFFVSVFPVLLIGALLWSPMQTRRGVLFGTSVPLDFAVGAQAQRIAARFRAGIVLVVA